MGAELDGQSDLDSRLARARDGILDLSEVNHQLAQLVDTQATKLVPRASGGLADSDSVTVTRDGWGIAYSKPYSVPVHWGTRYMRARPWLVDASKATEDSQLDLLTGHVQKLLD